MLQKFKNFSFIFRFFAGDHDNWNTRTRYAVNLQDHTGTTKYLLVYKWHPLSAVKFVDSHIPEVMFIYTFDSISNTNWAITLLPSRK